MPVTPADAAVRNLVPMVHVADVEKSLAFYALFGFAVRNRLPGPLGRTRWAYAECGKAEIMFAQAGPDLDPTVQAVLFYLYSENVAVLRRHLLANGLIDGGRYRGAPGPGDGRRVAFEITHPDYMPAGEFRVHDPDGYVLLVGQLA